MSDPYRIVPTDPDCPLCGHVWKRHDPDDGGCDAHAEEGFGACPCGRNRLWMAGRIAHLSKLFLIKDANARASVREDDFDSSPDAHLQGLGAREEGTDTR